MSAVKHAIVLGSALVAICGLAVAAQAPLQPVKQDGEVITVVSGRLQLKALLFRPTLDARAPAVLFHHGAGCMANEGPRILGNRFADRGYVFLWVYRRGAGLSSGQGECAAQEIAAARAAKGEDAAMDVQFRLLTTTELEDAIAGLAALRALPGIDPGRIVIAGHSFGAQLAMLSAERDGGVRAVLGFAGAARAWSRSEKIRARLIQAVGALKAPIYLGYAEDDNAEPGRVLAAELARLGKRHQLAIYPTGGHGFLFRADHPSEADIFRFLSEFARPSKLELFE